MEMLTRPYVNPMEQQQRDKDNTDPLVMRMAILVHHYKRPVQSVAMQCGVSQERVQRILADTVLRDKVRDLKLPVVVDRDDMILRSGR